MAKTKLLKGITSLLDNTASGADELLSFMNHEFRKEAIPFFRDNPKAVAAAVAPSLLLHPVDTDAAGLKQAIEAAKIAVRRLEAEYAAKYADAPSSSIPQRRMEKQISDSWDDIRNMEKQLSQSPTPAWGPTKGADTVEDMMRRYGDPKGGMGTPPAQMEQRMQMDMFEEAERKRRAEAMRQRDLMQQQYGPKWD